MLQKKAISFIEGVIKTIRFYPEDKRLYAEGMANALATFNVITKLKLGGNPGEYQPHLAVLHNIISRGLPTFASKYVEEVLSGCFGKTKEVKNEILGEFSFPFVEVPEIPEHVFDALHLIDSNFELDRHDYNQDLLESTFEKDFIFNQLTNRNQFIRQLLLPQRPFTSIVSPKRASNYLQQRVDLAIEIPYRYKENMIDRYGDQIEVVRNKGYIIEIDGTQHREAVIEDNNRDVAAGGAMWSVLRVRSGSEHTDVEHALEILMRDPYIRKCREIYSRKVEGKWAEILQLTLTPVAVARIQSVLVDFLISHPDYLDHKKRLKIAVLERDVPCGSLAIADLVEMGTNLGKLSEDSFYLPQFVLDIYSCEEFSNSPLHEIESATKRKSLIDFSFKHHDYDLVIDISILRRSLLEKITNAEKYITIRSSHYNQLESERIVYTAHHINYKPLIRGSQNDDYEIIEENTNTLLYFLSLLFRKINFLDGQLLILNRGLRNKSVIGLLPTGGGKSLTYQLATLLQPGVVLVVDPIKSLMQDQYENLMEIGIDTAVFINSSLPGHERRINTAKFSSGQAMFCFVSPERLVIKEFRDTLAEMFRNHIFFSYVIIDEVHCVSEWGHDFRTAYLSLGKNTVDYCKTKSGTNVPIFGLTATASFDVLADVERELSYKGNLDMDAIVRRENTIRNEIQYKIIDTFCDFERKMPFQINNQSFDHAGPLVVEEYDQYRNENVNKKVDKWKLDKYLGQSKKEKVNEITNHVVQDLSDSFGKDTLKLILEQSFDKFIEEKDIAELGKKYKIPISDLETLKQKYVDDQLTTISIQDHFAEGFYDELCRNATIVFCPHRSWHYGVTDKYKWQKYIENIYDGEGRLLHKKGEFIRDAEENKIPVPVSERNSIADHIVHPGIKIGTFIGSGGENEKEEKKIQEDSSNNQKAFIENDLNFMVATKAFGMGINKRNIRNTIHINVPSSLEGFIQEGGRAGRDRKMAVNYILLNKQEFMVWDDEVIKNVVIQNKKREFINPSEVESTLRTLNQLKGSYFYRSDFENITRSLLDQLNPAQQNSILECIPVKQVDRDILLYFHNRSFKGQDKEKAILMELRDRITFPNVPRSKILEERIKEEFLIDELYVTIWNDRRIYFNVGFNNSLGYIELSTLQMTNGVVPGFPRGLSKQILEMALHYIQNNYNGQIAALNIANWLKEKEMLPPESGFERWVMDDSIKVGSPRTFKVHFENFYTDIDEYAKRLFLFWKKTISEEALTLDAMEHKRIIPEDENLELYLNNIEEKLNIDTYDMLSEEQMNALKVRFYAKRKKEDTDKAIYRMQSMGLIEDYTIDYNNKMFHIDVIKKDTSAYIESLHKFIKRYYSEVKARREIEKIDQSDKRFIIRNCINFLTDFIYNEIEKKRRIAIDDMFAACDVGRNGKNLEFKEYIYTYFNSKFSRKPYYVNEVDYSLLSEQNTDNGKIQSFEIVWKFIDAVNGKVDGGQVDNLKHLRGACLRILRSNPDNAALHLLKAYALFILAGKNENLFKEASDSYFKGFTDFRDYYSNWTTAEFKLKIEEYKKLVLEHTTSKEVSETIERLTRLLYLELTTKKFHEFKTKFIKEYGN